MKRRERIGGARLALPFFVSLALCLVASTRVFAQDANAQDANAQDANAQDANVPALPQLEATPATLGADGVLTLTLPPGTALPQGKSTLRLALYEYLRPTKLAEIKKSFALQNGRWSTSLRLEADPGRYDFRLLADDKNRTPLSADATVLVPGVVREPGWWLINGSPFVEAPAKDEVLSPAAAPLFVPGLKRDGKKFDRKVFRSASPLKWRVLELPTLREIVETKDYDYNALTTKLQQRIAEARAKGEREFLGFTVSPETLFPPFTPFDLPKTEPLEKQERDALQHLRQIVDSLAPDAALIYQTSFATGRNEAKCEQELEELSGLCDAVALVPTIEIGFGIYPPSLQSWEIKVARRIAEEQSNYDLPIFLVSPWPVVLRINEHSIPINPLHIPLESAFSPFLLSGASGGVLIGENSALLKLSHLVQKNAGLFIGSVTLEDTGIRPLSDSPFLSSAYANPYGENGATVDICNLYTSLLLANRIPGLARLQKADKKKPESFMTILGDSISAETIEKLTDAARGGATIYLEGAPKIEDKDAERWSTLVGATSKPVETKQATMMLDDPWIFGTARREKVRVLQSVEVALKPPAPATGKEKNDKDKIQPEKGKDILTAPRVAATLEDGSPALIENPVGDGEVLWAPHRVISIASNQAAAHSFATQSFATKYYAAIAAQEGAALVELRTKGEQSTPPVHVAIRRSPKGAWLVGLFNESTQAASLTLEANHYAGVALDLQSEKELPLRTRGNRSFIQTTIPTNGWQIIALGASRKDLDDERFAPRTKAQLKAVR